MTGVAAIVLAGGKGTRLQAAISDRPKVLADVAGKPFLDHVLGKIEKSGIREVVLSTGYMADAVREEYGEGFGTLQLAFSHEEEPLGTGGAIRLALQCTRARTLLVLNGDSYCTADFGEFEARCRASAFDRGILLVHCDDCRDYGRVEVAGDGRITSYREKDGSPGPGWVNAGVYLLSRAAIETIPSGSVVSIERDIFPKWAVEGMFGSQQEGAFHDIGTPERYAAAERFFAEEAL